MSERQNLENSDEGINLFKIIKIYDTIILGHYAPVILELCPIFYRRTNLEEKCNHHGSFTKGITGCGQTQQLKLFRYLQWIDLWTIY